MVTIRKLRNHPYANCKVFEEEFYDTDTGVVTMRHWWLRSYSKDVVSVRETPRTWGLTCYGTHSQTTRRQIGWFLKDIGAPFTYYSVKRSFDHDSDIIVNK